MATVIDSLILELGIDAKQFQKGQKDATEAFVKTKEEALKSGKSIEESSDKAAQALAKVARQALELYAIFLGGRGVAQFISDITAGDAALGRFSGTLNESPRAIAAWGLAVEEIGGSSAATAASFRSLSDKIEDLKLRGKALPDVFYQLQAAGGRTIDLNHGVSKSMIDIAANLKAVAAHDQAKASWLGRQLGIDEDTVNRMIQDGAKIGDVIEKFVRKGPSEKDIKSAQALQKAWADLSQEAEHFGRSILNSISPALIDAMTRFDEWIAKKENQEEFNDAIKQFSDWIDKIDWPGIEKGVKEFATGADQAAQAVGGWKVVGEGLFGVWAVSKISGIALAVWGLVAALRAAVGASAALMLNPIIAGAVAAAAVLRPTPLNEGENELERQKKYGHDKHDAPGDAKPPSKSILDSITGAMSELFGIKGAKAEGIQTEGRQVSRSNPMPVMVTNGGSDQLSGRGINGSTGPASGGGTTPGGGGGSTPGGGSRGGGGGTGEQGPSGSANPATRAAMMAYAVDQLRKEGIPEPNLQAAAAHLVGQADMESGLNPRQSHDGGTGYGIYGARLDRRAAMFAWLRKNNYALDSAEGQMRYMAHEAMSGRYPTTRRILMGANKGSMRADSQAITHEFEGPRVDNYRAGAVEKAYTTPGSGGSISTPRVKPSPSVTNSSSTRTSNNSSSTETHIGSITVQTQATDAAGIAHELPKAIERSSFASQANSGPE